MPQKPKFTKEEIVAVAYSIAKDQGINALSARSLSKKLGCAISPIFTVFSSMEEVKEQVQNAGKIEFFKFLSESANYFPAFKEFGVRFLQFAKHNPNIFKMLFDSQCFQDENEVFTREYPELSNQMIESISKTFHLSNKDAKEVFNHMVTLGISVGMLIANGNKSFSEDEALNYFSEACVGVVLVKKLNSDTFDQELAEKLAMSTSATPQKIK